jgi:iron complex outermembrane receptor protein
MLIRKWGMSCLSIAMMSATHSVTAQDATAPAEALDTIPVQGPNSGGEAPETRAASKSRFIEEVVVTAQKREENLQDVPISVQAFSAEALDARGISDPVALQNITPGMTYSQTASYSIIYIRGVGTDAFIPSADASIATYIDGIYFPFSHGLAQNFGAVERVEVLKGPQGTLFGRNSTGGAISVITKKPGPDQEVSFQSSYGNYNDIENRVYVNIPVVDSLAVSVSALYNHSDFYYKLTDDSPHDPLAPEISKGARGRIKWSPTEDFDVTLSGLILEQSGTGNMLTQQSAPYPRYRLLGAQVTPDYKSSVDAPVYFNSRNPVVYGEANYRMNWFDAKVLASRQRVRSNSLYDYDASKAPLVSFEAIQMADVDTAELQLISNNDSWLSDRLKWIAGLYHIESLAGYNPVNLTVARDVATPLFSALSRLELPGLDLGDLLGGLGTSVNLPVTGLLGTNSTAGYFQATYHFTDWVAMTLGGRYQSETRTLVKSGFEVGLTDSLELPGLQFPQQSTKTSNFSPKVSLEFRPMDDLLVYASWQKGFKSGTYNIINIYVPSQFIEPEKVTAEEIGIKSTLFDHRLQFNAAVFNTEIENMQVQFISLLTGGAARFETAKRARTRGGEFDLLWEVAPDTIPGLVATASASYIDAKYTDYPVASGFNDAGLPFGGTGLVIGGGVGPGQDFSGHDIVRAPKFSGNTGLSYTIDAGDGTVELASDVYYNTGYYFSAQNVSTAEQKAYYLLNAHASYLYTPWNVRLTLFGKNITGEKYYLTKLPTDFGVSAALASPAVYGVRLNWDF